MGGWTDRAHGWMDCKKPRFQSQWHKLFVCVAVKVQNCCFRIIVFYLSYSVHKPINQKVDGKDNNLQFFFYGCTCKQTKYFAEIWGILGSFPQSA